MKTSSNRHLFPVTFVTALSLLSVASCGGQDPSIPADDPPGVVTCPTGQHLVSDNCVADPVMVICPTGEHRDGDNCVADPVVVDHCAPFVPLSMGQFVFGSRSPVSSSITLENDVEACRATSIRFNGAITKKRTDVSANNDEVLPPDGQTWLIVESDIQSLTVVTNEQGIRLVYPGHR